MPYSNQHFSDPSGSAKTPWWTKGRIHVPGFDFLTVFCLALIFIHLAIEFSGGVIQYEILYTQNLGLSTGGLGSGKLWQLVTHAFLHGSWLHLLTNVFMIWIMGGRLLFIIGEKKLIITVLLSCLAGGGLFVFFDFLSGDNRPLVGASGIGFGLFILMAMLAPCARVRPFPISAKNMAYGVLAASLILCLVNPSLSLPMFQSAGIWLNSIQLSDVFRIAHACHLGGGLIGIYMSYRIMGKLMTLEDLKSQRLE